VTRVAKVAGGLLGLGVVALLLAEATGLQVAAALFLLVGVGAGVFAVATPEFLAGDDDDRSGDTRLTS
jgi:hypothetical protein